MSQSIFIVGSDNVLKELKRSDYDTEDLFQGLLADHPAMLNAASGTSGGLMLISREQPVPDQLHGADRWSLDHLFLDREGVPVLVEVKQASDTRARREVVAQMLDYAANGVAYWPLPQLMASFEETASALGSDADALLDRFLDGGDHDLFWRRVEANLRSGRIRLLFVADRIPPELARIVEFLNEQMRPAEVLAIEVEQYVAPDGVRTFVPKLLGATERAKTSKSVDARGEKLTEEEWLDDLADRHGADARRGAEKIIDWFRSLGVDASITRSQDAIGIRLPRPEANPLWVFYVRRSSGRLETSLQNLAASTAFSSDEARSGLLERIRGLPSTTLNVSDKLTGWPSIELAELLQNELWAAFTQMASDIREAVERG